MLRASSLGLCALALLACMRGVRANDAQLECVTRVTPEDEDGTKCRAANKEGTECGYKQGYNSVFYLDRQNVDCGAGYVLQSFKLKRGPSKETIYYEYVCCTGPWLHATVSSLFPVLSGPTRLQDGRSAINIDRNTQQCGAALLQKFQLTRGQDSLKDLYQYDYTCQNVSPTALGSCVDVVSSSTPYGDNNNGDIRYLDRLVADCSSKGPLYVMSGWTVGVNRSPANSNWRYKYRCCPINLAPPSIYEFSTLHLQTPGQDGKCVSWSAGQLPVTIGDCNSQAGPMWYATPTTSASLRLYPYPQIFNGTYFLQRTVSAASTNAVALAEGTAQGIIIDSERDTVVFADDSWRMASSPSGSVVATQAYNSSFSYSFQAVKVPSPLTIPDMGKICRNLDKFGWVQPNCPFAPVVGTGGKSWASSLAYIGSTALAGMTYPSAYTFYVKEFGNVTDTMNAGAKSLLGGLKISYVDGPSAASAVTMDLNALTATTCTFGLMEWVTKLQIMPSTVGPIDDRAVAGLRWTTSKGKVCSVPASIADDPAWGAIPVLSGSTLGNGMPYGAVIGLNTDGYIGALGFVNYEEIVAMISMPEWSVAAANQNMVSSPNALATQTCDNTKGNKAIACTLSFDMSSSNEESYSHAYETTNEYSTAKQYAETTTGTVTITLNAKAGVPANTMGVSSAFQVEQGFTYSNTITQANTETLADTTASSVTSSTTTTCAFAPVVPAGHSITVSGLQTKGNYTIPWSGVFSYYLKGGVVFNFSGAGDYSAALESGCFFSAVYAPPLSTSASVKSAASAPAPNTTASARRAARALPSCTLLQACASSLGKPLCSCALPKYCVRLNLEGVQRHVCKAPTRKKFNRATTVRTRGSPCKKWHRVTAGTLDLGRIARDCKIDVQCLLDANSDFLVRHRKAAGSLKLKFSAVGKYVDIGCFYPSVRPKFAWF